MKNSVKYKYIKSNENILKMVNEHRYLDCIDYLQKIHDSWIGLTSNEIIATIESLKKTIQEKNIKNTIKLLINYSQLLKNLKQFNDIEDKKISLILKLLELQIPIQKRSPRRANIIIDKINSEHKTLLSNKGYQSLLSNLSLYKYEKAKIDLLNLLEFYKEEL